MANPEHLKILKQGVDAWNKWRKENRTIKPDLSGADLCGADLSRANFKEANLESADLIRAVCWKTYFRFASLAGANLTNVYLCDATLKNSDCTNTRFFACTLIRCNMSNAILTGSGLFGTARDGWIIDGVVCKYIYWDAAERKRTPADRDFEPGEFERLYKSLPTIEYVFENGMSPIDPLIMNRVVESIQDRLPEYDIKIDSINARGLAPSIKFTVQHEEHKEAALAEVKKQYEAKLKIVKAQRDQYWEAIKRSLESPKYQLVAAESGSIVAVDGSTINIEQHVNYAIELQKAIEQAPEETLGKKAKKIALDIIGDALKDIAKGQIKEAAKQIVELGKDLAPIIVNTAAYTFFKNLLT